MWRLYYIGMATLQAGVFFLPVVWTILYFGFHRGVKSVFLESILGIYLILVLAAVGFPALWDFTVDFSVNLISFYILFDFSAGYVANMLLNILLFLPLGLLLPLLYRDCRTLKRTVMMGFMFSLFIELMQIFSFRTTDVDDLMMNTLGAAAGYGIYRLVSRSKFVNRLGSDCCGRAELMVIFAVAALVSFLVGV